MKRFLGKLAQGMTFEVRLFLLLLTVSSILLFVVGYYVSLKMQDSLYEQMGQHAEVQAKQIAAMPELVRAVETRNLDAIADIVQIMKQRTDASFIVIGDEQGRRLYHPFSPVGTPMQGDDNAPVLVNGESEITLRQGSLGFGLRGKAPIKNAKGVIIGVVSVGYLQDMIFKRYVAQRGPVILFLAFALGVLFLSAWMFAKGIKRQMLNLEPLDIARLARQQEAVFESIKEGVIAIDRLHRVTAINRAAREILGYSDVGNDLIGLPLSEVVADPSVDAEVDEAKEIRDEIFLFRNIQVIVNRVPIVIDHKPQGWVISFRRKDDISTLSMQLSQIKRYADNLRVIRHEHMNWISTLSGLLQMRYFDEALQLAKMQSETQQRTLDYISDTFLNPQVCGLLLGKFYRARELGLQLEFDPGCRLTELPPVPAISEWMSIIGNLLDNAFDASLSEGAQGRTITFYMADSDAEVIIEVADLGSGVDESVRERIFERGVSTKGSGERGIGLYLVKTFVEQAGGVITIDDNEPCGTVFSVFVPKGDKGGTDV